MNSIEIAKWADISVRTLHYYDEIGLLSPRRDENGYRNYTDEDVDRLLEILAFKQCGFPLKQIKALLGHPDYDRAQAFAWQRDVLLRKRSRIDQMIGTLEKTLLSMKGEISMTSSEKLGGFNFKENPYEEEARALWGDEAVDESQAKLDALNDDELQETGDSMDRQFKALAAVRQEDPASKVAQEAVAGLVKTLNQIGTYPPEAIEGLGRLYVEDARFTANIDKYGEGLAKFLSEAMAIYARNVR